MESEWKKDLRTSTEAFQRLVWPAVSPLIQGGRLIVCESNMSTDLHRALDMHAGIDAWQVNESNGRMRGIASRVQFLPPAVCGWDTFTIRHSRVSGTKTEFQKRCEAADQATEGWLLPHLTIQAYTDKPPLALLSAAVVKTTDLLIYARKHEHENSRTTIYRKSTHNAIFLVIPWQNLLRDGVWVGVVRGEPISS